MARLDTLEKRRQQALDSYKYFIREAKEYLRYAREDRAFGAVADYREDMYSASYCRERALAWYKKYRNQCERIAAQCKEVA